MSFTSSSDESCNESGYVEQLVTPEQTVVVASPVLSSVMSSPEVVFLSPPRVASPVIASEVIDVTSGSETDSVSSALVPFSRFVDFLRCSRYPFLMCHF